MFRAIAAAIADLFSRMRAFSIAPPRVGLTSSSVEGEHISSVDAKKGGIHTRQQVMGVPGLRDDGDKLSSQPEPKTLPRDDDAEEKTAVHNTIHSGSDEERNGATGCSTVRRE